ncbi:class I adenylate cyclase [Phocoenobacter skyensis]|uniref:Class I adenylate cyclase n=1 Tax=Phocoenobacter skyensis TaxID=97481 RepID=A0ABT9JNA4_9PAST|nr:class I adenylate cyclase [Pasteurella skyensis]MDP8080321.1 class I adenylate cyclase [Pasteurella skyensis]MDP8086296.1 class I adenylate cyclase [Pasteurella skyensis]
MSQLSLLSKEYQSVLQMEIAKQQVDALDELRIERALSSYDIDSKHIFQLLPVLINYNHPSLPGYVPAVSKGIWHFTPTAYQDHYLQEKLGTAIELFTEDEPDFDGIYAMGSTGSISQTPLSDLDIWVCSEKEFSVQQRSLIESKFNLIKEWANQFQVEIHFYLMNPNQFKNHLYHNQVSKENSGSAQHFFLLDEFYRSAIRLAGKRILWLHLLKSQGQSYQEAIDQAVANGLVLSEWVDFGDFSELSIDEFFGASLWQLYKSINSPYKSALKILLLESYTKTYPETNLISKQFKKILLEEGRNDYHFDPYLAMLEQVTDYLIQEEEFERLENIRCCFYIKVTSGKQYRGGRLSKLQDLISQWQWSPEQLNVLDSRSFWKIKQAMEHQQTLVDLFIQSYYNLVNFARKLNVEPRILSQDSDALMRQLYSTFEVLPDKVPLLNNKIKWNLEEKELTFVESNSSTSERGWYLLNHEPKIVYNSSNRYVQYFPHLTQLVAWAYFNGLIAPKTRLHIMSKTVSLAKLRKFITDLRLYMPIKSPLPSSEAWYHPNEIRHLAVIVNLTKDSTYEQGLDISKLSLTDLFNLSSSSQRIIGSIGLIYRNMWNEIRTEYFEGDNALLDALKLLSNKLYQSVSAPHSLNVFCYSHYLNYELQMFISNLVNRCIVVQTGVNYQKQSSIRSDISNKKWQLVFEDSVVSDEPKLGNVQQESKMAYLKANPLPKEIGNFAVEGFTQFFFENRGDKTFNVYILDEKNQLDIYLNCIGSKAQKVRLINATYAEKKAEKISFSFPQFYQFTTKGGEQHIELFKV